tara:strand:- start:170 stop:568 length:399 start_codon:yes stop_codon:yes gene_type:complete
MDLAKWKEQMKIIGLDCAYFGRLNVIKQYEKIIEELLKEEQQIRDEIYVLEFAEEKENYSKEIRTEISSIKKKQKKEDFYKTKILEEQANIRNKKINKTLMPLGKVWNKKENAWFLHSVNCVGEHNFKRLWD